MTAIEHPLVFWPLVVWLVFVLIWVAGAGSNEHRSFGMRMLEGVIIVALIVVAVAAIALLVGLFIWSIRGQV